MGVRFPHFSNSQTNTTKTLQGPSIKDSLATYFASTNSLVQLSSTGTVSYMPYSANSTSASPGVSWNTVKKLPVALSPSSTAASSASVSNTAKGAAATGNASGSNLENDALSMSASGRWGVSGLVACALAALCLWF